MQSVSFTDLIAEQLDLAHKGTRGRAAHTIYGGSEHRLRETVMALLAGTELAEHESPGEATLQVLHGNIELTAGSEAWIGEAGDHVIIPPARHSLSAITDAVILLTVSAAEVHESSS